MNADYIRVFNKAKQDDQIPACPISIKYRWNKEKSWFRTKMVMSLKIVYNN